MQESGQSGEEEGEKMHGLPGKGHGCLPLRASASPGFCGFVFLNLGRLCAYGQPMWSVLYLLLSVLLPICFLLYIQN